MGDVDLAGSLPLFSHFYFGRSALVAGHVCSCVGFDESRGGRTQMVVDGRLCRASLSVAVAVVAHRADILSA